MKPPALVFRPRLSLASRGGYFPSLHVFPWTGYDNDQTIFPGDREVFVQCT